MAEKGDKNNKPSAGMLWANKPVPMKFFGAWEVDKTPPNCIPRLCTLTVNKLVLLMPLGPDVTSVMVAVKMQSSKRTLRSNEINVPNIGESPNGLEVELDLTFALQYPHYLKKGGNQLQILLQRRKRYKNRAILGFKTMAGGVINMAEVLQRSNYMEKQLELRGNTKDLPKSEIVGRIFMSTLKSQPVDQEVNGRNIKLPLDRSAEVDSDEDGEGEDYTSNDEGSDSETVEEANVPGAHSGPTARERLNQWRRQVNSRNARKLFFKSDPSGEGLDPNKDIQQRNFKQKFIALLKKFKIPEPESFDDVEQYQQAVMWHAGVMDGDGDGEGEGEEGIERDNDDDYLEEDDTDSTQEFDDLSISSTPKPSLRPFFSSTIQLGPEADFEVRPNGVKRLEIEPVEYSANSEQTPDNSDTSLKHPHPEENKKLAEKEKKSKLFATKSSATSGTKDKERKSRASEASLANVSAAKEKPINSAKDVDSSPRKSVLEQLSRAFSMDDTAFPEQVVLLHVNEGSVLGQSIAQQLSERQYCVIGTYVSADVKASFTHLVNKIQRFCNCNSKAPSPIKIAVLGSDGYVNSVLRFYVETLSKKPPEWQNYLRFYPIPIGSVSCTYAKYLGSIDPVYYDHFGNGFWKDFHEGHTSSSFSYQDVVNRIANYLTGATFVAQMPVAEAMIMYKEKSNDDQCVQVFIPFTCDVKIGIMEANSYSLDEDKEPPPVMSSSPPSSSSVNNSIPHIEKSLSLMSPVGAKDLQHQQTSQLASTPPSSPSISVNLSATTSSPPTSILASPAVGSVGLISLGLETKGGGVASAAAAAAAASGTCSISSEPMDLQVDYWPIVKWSESTKKAESSKFTLKNTFRTLHVSRLPINATAETQSPPALTLSYVTKEKKQKIMRLGKKKEKERELDNKCQVAEGIHRLVCSCKTTQAPLKVTIDGTEWTGVKFFQLTAQWQTHTKSFPVAIFTPLESSLGSRCRAATVNGPILG